MTGVAEKGSETVIRYWVQDRILKKRAEPEQHVAKKSTDWHDLTLAVTNFTIRYTHCDQLTNALQERVVTVAILLLGLAIFIAFWNRDAWPTYSSGSPQEGSGHAKQGFSISFGSQPEGLLQWALGKSYDGKEHVPAGPWESLTDSNDGRGDI